MDRSRDAVLTVRAEESRPLTGLRGVAALLVLSHHLYLHLAPNQPGLAFEPLLRKGYLGVDLFFVISGFVLTMVYGTWFELGRRAGPLDYLRFVARRVARLWPSHVTMLAVVLATNATLGATPSLRLVSANVAMIQAWGISAEINPPAWSVSTEFMAYLLFPALAMLSARGRWGVLLCAGASALGYALCLRYAPAIGPGRRGLLDIYFNNNPLPLFRCLSGFIIGMLAWHAGQLPAVRRLAAWWLLGPLALLLFAAAMQSRLNDLLTLALLPVLALGMHYGRGPVHSALGSPPLHTLGLLSYPIYLVHYLLISIFPFDSGPLPATLPLYLAATIGSAAVLYRLVEQPGRRLLRAVADSVIPGPAPPPAAPLHDGSH